jgi:hypothetical protein
LLDWQGGSKLSLADLTRRLKAPEGSSDSAPATLHRSFDSGSHKVRSVMENVAPMVEIGAGALVAVAGAFVWMWHGGARPSFHGLANNFGKPIGQDECRW